MITKLVPNAEENWDIAATTAVKSPRPAGSISGTDSAAFAVLSGTSGLKQY
jgi:hypothetical protein